MPEARPARPELRMVLDGLSLIEDQVDFLRANVEPLQISNGAQAQWAEVTRLATQLRGVWRGVEAAAAPAVNPMRIRPHDASVTIVNARGYEGIWRHLHNRIKFRMDAVDRALIDGDAEALATAMRRLRERVGQTYDLVSVGDVGAAIGSGHPELAMLSSGLKRIVAQLDVLSFCMGQLPRDGGTEPEHADLRGDVAEQVELVKGIWWGVERTVVNFVDSPPQLGPGSNSYSVSVARAELFSELKLATEVTISAISKAFQAGDYGALATAVGAARRQLDASRRAVAGAPVSTLAQMNGAAGKPLGF